METDKYFKYLKASFYLASHYLGRIFPRDSTKINKIIILTYHRVLEGSDYENYFRRNMSVLRGNFINQIAYLNDNFNIISLDDAISYANGSLEIDRLSIVITFDDGYIDNYTEVYPLLKKYNIPATIFLTTDPLDSGRPLWWDKLDGLIRYCWDEDGELSVLRKSPFWQYIDPSLVISRIHFSNKIVNILNSCDRVTRGIFWDEVKQWMLENSIPEPESLMLTWDMVKEMSHNNITFESHTKSHAFLDELDFDGLADELLGGRDRIRTMTGQPADILACPRGRMMTSRQMDFIKQEFRAVCTTVPGFVDVNSDLYSLKRKDSGYLSLGDHFYEKCFLSELIGHLDRIRSLNRKSL